MTTIKAIFEAEREFIRSAYPIYEQPFKIQRIDRAEYEVLEVINTLQSTIDEYRDDYKDIMAENCSGDDRKHCTCVPPLKIRVRELEKQLSAAEDDLRNWVQAYINKRKPAFKDGLLIDKVVLAEFNNIETALWGAIPQVCEWAEYDSEYPGTYTTSCGHMFSFTADGIKENGAKYCQYCGKPIKEVKK